MFDEIEKKNLSNGVKLDKRGQQKAPFAWKTLRIDELVRFRDEINACLPPTSLSELNLEEEMLLQFHSIRAVQTMVLNDEELPLTQRTSIVGAVAASLNKLAELQQALYSSERFKQIENLLIRSLGRLPEEIAEKFIQEYEKILVTSNGK